MKQLIKVAGLISAIIAAVSLGFVFYQSYSESNAQRIRDWQEVVVFRVIEEASFTGIGFDEIRKKYQDEVTDFNEFQIPKNQIQSPALKRILLVLLSKHVIAILKDGHYRVSTDPIALSEPMMEHANKLQPVAMALLDLLRDGGHYSISTLEHNLLKKFEGKGVTPEEITEVITMGIANRMIRADEKGNIQSNLIQIQNKPAADDISQ